MLNLAVLLLSSAFRMIVIPAQFQDREFVLDRADIEATVSEAERYFNDQFRGGTVFTFDVAPTVTLPKAYSYYGANYTDRRDVLLHEAVRTACSLSDGEIDFSLYDNDSDGYVDNVCLLVAGPSESDGAAAENFWPQHGLLQDNGGVSNFDGKHIDSFTASTELGYGTDGASGPAGIGVFCHELAHSFGLYDLYDTDLEGSGGLSDGLKGTSLMDFGCKNENGQCPPNFNAIDLELLGIGQCEQLTQGRHTLSPVNKEGRYFKAQGETEGEYFLFECREAEGWDAPIGGGGLLIYHIDRSENPAGFSDYYQKELSAIERWENGQVNCRPDRPCAYIVTADPEAVDAGGAFFPQNGRDDFSSDSQPPFRFWNGRTYSLAVTDIVRNQDGSVSFNVVEPITVEEVSVFQDAAIIKWKTDKLLHDISHYEISWTDGEQTYEASAPKDALSFTIEGLSAQTAYRFTISLTTSGGHRYSATSSFITKIYREGTYPYVYLSGTVRNVDGSFPIGAKIPLRIFNATGVASVRWYFDGREISTGEDGYFTVSREGTLKAEILYEDGTREYIIKEIRL